MQKQIGIKASTKVIANTFFSEFRNSNLFGESAIRDTFQRAFNGYKYNGEYLAALTAAMNRLCLLSDKKGYERLAAIYANYYYQCRDYALDNLKGDELSYFRRVID